MRVQDSAREYYTVFETVRIQIIEKTEEMCILQPWSQRYLNFQKSKKMAGSEVVYKLNNLHKKQFDK